MSAWTKGPWRTGKAGGLMGPDERYIRTTGGLYLAHQALSDSESDANRRIIIAAPELADALLGISQIVRHRAHLDERNTGQIEAFLDAALAKVEG